MIYFLFPVYNEEQNLYTLLANTQNTMQSIYPPLDYHIIFVNDGSTDNSLNILTELKQKNKNITVLSHTPNKGVMKTFLEGFEEFLKIGKSDDVLVTQEADNTSCNNILSQMLTSVINNGYDLALASCYHKDGKVVNTTLLRKILSSTANLLVKVRFGLWGYNTFSSFYRVYSYNCLKNLFGTSKQPMTINGYCCVVELLIRLVKQNNKIIEIPMILDTSKRKGKSKMKIIKTIIGYLKLFSLKI